MQIIEARSSLHECLDEHQHQRLLMSIDITTEMLKKCALETELLGCIVMSDQPASRTEQASAANAKTTATPRSASANRSVRPASHSPGVKTGGGSRLNGWAMDSIRRTPTGAINSTPLTGALRRTPNTTSITNPSTPTPGQRLLLSVSPIDSLMRDPAAVHSLVGNVDNYCTCCRSKLVEVQSLRSIRKKHSQCRNCIHHGK